MDRAIPPQATPASEGGLSVIVVDSHRLVAESLARMLPQLETVREATFATTMASARSALLLLRVDLVLVSERVEGEPAVLALQRGAAHPLRRPALVVLASSNEPRAVARAFRDGAAGWIRRDCRLEELAEALTAVRDGGHWVAPELRAGVIDALLEKTPDQPVDGLGLHLSPRQQEVLQGLMDGMSHGEVAERLHLSLNTVRTHVHRMCHQAGVHSTPALVALARDGRLALPDKAVRPRPT